MVRFFREKRGAKKTGIMRREWDQPVSRKLKIFDLLHFALRLGDRRTPFFSTLVLSDSINRRTLQVLLQSRSEELD
jgi:hypothetical protein